MANKPLVEIKPGQGLDTGVFPTAEPTAGPLWRQANNVWYRSVALTHTIGRAKVVSMIGRASHAMTQAYVEGVSRLYYEDLGIINRWEGSGVGTIIDELDPNGSYDLEPYGDWLLATDNVSKPKLWKNNSPTGWVDIGQDEFQTGKIIKKMAQRVLIYNTDVYSAGVHYSKVSDPEVWLPVVGPTVTGAGNLPFRNLDSPIIAVANLSGTHAVYTEDKLSILEYLGEDLRFGIPRQPIAGIGAVSKDSVVEQSGRNFGVFPGGVFVTDGTTFKMLDDPAMSDWLREMVDWNRGDEVSGYWDRRLSVIVWSLPLYGGDRQGITLDPSGRFSFIDAEFRTALEQEIFDFPFIAQNDGIYKASVTGTILGRLEAGTHLLDAADKEHYKAWDFAIFEGTLSGEVRFGYADSPDFDSIIWTEWETIMHRVPLVPYESVYLAIQMRSDEAFKLASIKIYGAPAGLVI